MIRVRSRSPRTGLAFGFAIALAFVPRAGRAQETVSPHGDLRSGLECSLCHTTAGWRSLREPLGFDHGKATRFALTGRHAAASCSGCHLDLRFDQPRLSTRDCASCHLDVHQGQLSADCASCHNTRSFRDAASIEQHARTRFPLNGAHSQISCESCHTNDRGGAWTALDTDCWSCHRQDYAAAKVVDHEGAGMPHDCTMCHATAAWRAATFDHATVAHGFTLDGRHATMQCSGCHGGPGASLKWTPSGVNDCVACHQADYDRQHAGSEYPIDCQRCHTTNGWSSAAFDHATVANGFDLTGGHGTLLCTDCHIPPDFTLKWPKPASPSDCVACHRPDYDRQHTGSGYPTTCLSCHDVNDWTHAVFDHVVGGNGFPLLGAHAAAPCTSCHGANNELLFPKPASPDDCVACHRADYDAQHTGSGYPTTCADCHSTTSFAGATFDHSTTPFPLVGAHVSLACTSCHGANNALLFPTPSNPDDCIACHQADYDSNHTGSGYPTTCLTCHNTSSFQGSTLNHDAAFFPIYSGAHQGRWSSCQQCHASAGDYSVFTCLSCHVHDQSSMDSHHSAVSGYAYDSFKCYSCHPQGKS